MNHSSQYSTLQLHKGPYFAPACGHGTGNRLHRVLTVYAVRPYGLRSRLRAALSERFALVGVGEETHGQNSTRMGRMQPTERQNRTGPALASLKFSLHPPSANLIANLIAATRNTAGLSTRQPTAAHSLTVHGSRLSLLTALVLAAPRPRVSRRQGGAAPWRTAPIGRSSAAG